MKVSFISPSSLVELTSTAQQTFIFNASTESLEHAIKLLDKERPGAIYRLEYFHYQTYTFYPLNLLELIGTR